jgi:RimJ/RimL family protein N-acetyltransferase
MPFDLQPTLTGTRLALRPLGADDFDALYAVASDPLIWAQHPDSNRFERAVFQRFFQDAIDSGGALLATDRADGRVIGSSRFHGYNEAASEIEIGWTFLARSHWGGTFNGEMKALMLRHAFRVVRRVLFVIGPQNLRSRVAIEKIGGILVDTRRGPDGRESVVYAITATGYASTPRS